MSENIKSIRTMIAKGKFASSSATSETIDAAVIEQSLNSPSEPIHCYKRTTSPQTTLDKSSLPPTPLPSGSGLFSPVRSNSKYSEHDEEPLTPSFSIVVSSTVGQEPINSPPIPSNVIKRMFSLLSNVRSRPMPQSAPVTNGHFSMRSNFPVLPMSRREIAEIQLHALLTDKEESLPISVHRAAEMSFKELSKQLDTPPFILERLLKVINSLSGTSNLPFVNQNNVIRLTRTLNSTLDVRALLFFMMLDEDTDKRVTRNEMDQFLKLYFKSISFDTYYLQDAIRMLLQEFYHETKTQIDFEEFYSIVIGNPAVLKSFSGFTVNPIWFLPEPPSPSHLNLVQRCCTRLFGHETFHSKHKSKLTHEYVSENLSRIVVATLYILVNLALFLYVIIYRSTVTKSYVFVVLARIGGILLDFNCSLVIVLMFKQTILFIRSHRLLRRLIPVDSHIDFHKFVGRFITVLVILHTIAHIINFSRLPGYSWHVFMFTTIPGIGWVGGFAPLSGLILCIILATMVICSMEWVRQKGHFQVFYWTHVLYIVFFIFLIIHAKDFWKWAIGPLSWLFLEKLYSFFTRYSPRSGRTHLISATIEKSNVIKLNMHRPKNFTFKPGDYITINLPSVALYEFHPFTISSAPEQTDVLHVHIQASGNWTKQVYQRFKDMSENESNRAVDVIIHRADLNPIRATAEERNEQNIIENENEGKQREINNMTTIKTKKEIVIVNGPYSSCARYIFDCEHAVLIGGGIGITPYASILPSLMAQFHASHTIEQRVNDHRTILVEHCRLKQVDFIWVTRDHKSFEWFLQLLDQFEQEQEAYLALNPDKHRFLTIHLYFTEIKSDQFVGHYPFALITQLWAQGVGKDIFTGLKSRTHIGRPDWDKFFIQLSSGENRSAGNNVNVFYCGRQDMGKTIQECCTKHHFRFYKENF